MGFVSKKRGGLAWPRSKKANMLHEIYMFITYIVMLLIVSLVLFQYVNNVATDLGFEKKFTSIDAGLLTTAVFFAPGTLKHVYSAPHFGVPMEIIFTKSLLNVKETGKKLNMYYFHMSELNTEPLEETISLPASKTGPNFTYYKSGRQVVFDQKYANALQMKCPLLNTSDDAWKSNKIFIAKVMPEKDLKDANLPANRIPKVLSARYSQITVSSKTAATSAPSAGSKISAIPSDAKLVIAMGDSGEKREQGSLVVYIPVDDNTLQQRKLACFMINDLLTAETSVFYVQVMPVYPDTLKKESPLNIFKEKSKKDQVMVFLDLSTFTEKQVDIDKASAALYRAIERYYGGYNIQTVNGATLSFSASAPSQTGASTTPSQAPSTAPGSQTTPSQTKPKDEGTLKPELRKAGSIVD
jgi:hypothetical protein